MRFPLSQQLVHSYLTDVEVFGSIAVIKGAEHTQGLSLAQLIDLVEVVGVSSEQGMCLQRSLNASSIDIFQDRHNEKICL